ncbi:MAG: carotenoid oxygenase family protein [Acidimicrobiales bacterium]|nr:carotenoid oxygenase family protein [Acidimicrobiales bacterium]
MTSTMTGSVTNAADQQDLRDNMFPVDREIEVDQCEVEGEIPPGLRGMFVRNGPNPMFEPIGKYHMFDGDGMLHGVAFADGKASYRNRWIRSRGLQAEVKLGRAAYPGLSDVMNFPSPDLVGDAGPVKNPANTHIVRHAVRLLALWEQGLPTEIAPDLGTVGEWDFAGELKGAMTAHPRIDPRTGEMFFFAYNFFPPFLVYYVVDAAGKLIKRVELDLPAPIMMHDMLITEDYSVFMDSPIVFDMEALSTGGSMVQWKQENGTRIGVMPRMGDADSIRWFEVPTSHVQHFWNAWQDGNRVEITGCRFEQVDFGIETEASDKESGIGEAGGVPARYWVDLDSGDAGSEFFDDEMGEFCRINDDYTGIKSDKLYMSGFTRPGARGGDFDTIVKYDQATDTRTKWYSGDSGHIGENVFAPDPDGSAEDDGWIVNSSHDSATGQSEVLVLDARDIEAGPIARVQVPQRMPFGFHANWFPASE